jgi:hypothetical protein
LLQFIGDDRPRPKYFHADSNVSATTPWSRFIVSCSSDHTLADSRSQGASSRLESIGAHIVHIPDMAFEDESSMDGNRFSAVSFMEHVLKQQGRRLQNFQLDYIRDKLLNMSLSCVHDGSVHDLTTSSPAYVNMLALQARLVNNLIAKPFPKLSRSEKTLCNTLLCRLLTFVAQLGQELQHSQQVLVPVS